jgi:protoporphyrinogen oxidase
MKINDISIIGSGISGISIARILNKKNIKIEIFEKENLIGGLIKCEKINGNLFHKVGGHVFNSKNETVLNWFWKNFDKEKEFIPATRNAKIFMNDSLVGYPIENFIYQLPEADVKLIILDLIEKLKSDDKSQLSGNFESFLINNFGNKLYELYFKPYNEKIWKSDLSLIPLEWLEGKLPMPNIRTIISNNILRSKEDDMVHSKFWYPKSGGSQFIIDRLSQGITINVKHAIKSIKYINGVVILNDSVKTRKLIFTGNVKDLIDIVDINDIELKQSIYKTADFISNGTSNVLCETDDTDLSWLYIPEEKYLAHRIIYTGNFSDNNNNSSTISRKTCVVEFSGKHSVDTMVLELKKLPGNLHPISFNYEANSYVIQNKNTRNIISDLKDKLLKYNIYLHGRFAEWEYYNMDVCIEKSMELSKIFCK